MSGINRDCLTEQHLLLFGSIIQWFARYEVLMQDVMAVVSGSDVSAIMLLTRGLDFISKRQALLDLLRHRAIPLDQQEQVYRYLIPVRTLAPLRNDIAHSAWTAAPNAHSIQPEWILHLGPRVLPLRDDPGAPASNFVPTWDDKLSYTLDDLSKDVETLATNYHVFADYLRSVRLIRMSTREAGSANA